MPDETTQPNPELAPTPPETQNSEASSIPVSPQEPTTEAPIQPIESIPAEVPPVAPETPPSPIEAIPLNNDISANEPLEKQREENLKLANQTRQDKKRKKIDAILDLFAKQTNLTNDEVEKLLHVSDATATRYLETLEKEGKIKQVGKTGKAVSYNRV